MIDSIIFDLDGTLWDASKQICHHWQKTFSHQTLEQIQSMLGKTTEGIANCLGVSEELVTKVQQSENDYLRANPGKLYSDVPRVLDSLYHKGYRLFIASNCQSGYIETFLSTKGLSEYFEGYICSGDTGKSKTNNVKFLVEKYSLNPVLIGDTENDLIAATQNGLPFVWASYGFGNLDCLNKIESLSQLLDYLRR